MLAHSSKTSRPCTFLRVLVHGKLVFLSHDIVLMSMRSYNAVMSSRSRPGGPLDVAGESLESHIHDEVLSHSKLVSGADHELQCFDYPLSFPQEDRKALLRGDSVQFASNQCSPLPRPFCGTFSPNAPHTGRFVFNQGAYQGYTSLNVTYENGTSDTWYLQAQIRSQPTYSYNSGESLFNAFCLPAASATSNPQTVIPTSLLTESAAPTYVPSAIDPASITASATVTRRDVSSAPPTATAAPSYVSQPRPSYSPAGNCSSS